MFGVIHGSVCYWRLCVITSWRCNELIPAFHADMAKMPWNTLMTPDNIDKKLDDWNLFLGNKLDKHFPLSRKRIQQKSQPWLDNLKVDEDKGRYVSEHCDNHSWELCK